MSRHKKEQLNRCLDPRKFEVCVPLDCLMWREGVGSGEEIGREVEESIEKAGEFAERDLSRQEKESLSRWNGYRKKLRRAAGRSSCQGFEFCWIPGPDPRLGIKLRGRCAVEHAKRVHARLRRQLLRFKDVSAVDVGFAVWERRKRFINLLSIRVHVAKKHPLRYLHREGLPDFTNPMYAFDCETVSKCFDEATGPAGRIDRKEVCRELSKYHGLPTDCLDDWIRRMGRHHHCSSYPIPGVTQEDLSHHVSWLCREESCWIDFGSSKPREHDCSGEPRPYCRLAICGVPLDIIDARYFPSVQHSGGDDADGVFVGPLETARELDDGEQLLTGRGRVNPLVGGVSIGTLGGRAGTLGTIVWDRTDGSPCVLSNWHVLAGNGRAQVGQPTFQPAIFDGGTEKDTIAHLKRWHLGELGDAALAELDGGRNFASGEILGMWHPVSGYQRPELNLEIRKWGRTTGFTEGFVDGVCLATNIDYGGGFIRHFENQFHIAPLFAGDDVSQMGDSGSLVLTSYSLDELQEDRRNLGDISRAVIHSSRPGGPWDRFRNCVKRAGDEVEALAEECRDFLRQEGSYIPGAAGLFQEFQELVSREIDVGRLKAGARAAKLVPRTSPLDTGALREILDELLGSWLEENGIDSEKTRKEKEKTENTKVRNVYFAVGLIFAGDTPGSPFGEFALASDLEPLADDLRFSLRPVFEPRSSFRELRRRPGGRGGRRDSDASDGRQPGEAGADSRGSGPQPEGEPLRVGPGGGG